MIPAAIERWLRALSLAGVLLCVVVILLGAFTRLTNAGIRCPDWPQCHGHLTPLGAADSPAAQARFPGRPLGVERAWHEMIHRYAAGVLGLVILVITALAIASRGRIVARGYAVALFATVIVQVLLGMLTVTWLLKPLIVTAHLIFGMTTLALLWWIWLTLQRPGAADGGGKDAPAIPGRDASGARNPRGRASYRDSLGAVGALRLAYGLSILGLVVLGVQFFLGAWTSANHAAYACPDFPSCNGAWLPHADFRQAFVLWRGIRVDFRGGILPNAARVAIQLAHRLGALAVTLALGAASVYVIGRRALLEARGYAYTVLAALIMQLTIGISMVLKSFPLGLTTAHTAGAALLLMASLALVYKLRSMCVART